MSALFPDTTAEAEQVLIELMRCASVPRKLEMLGQMNAAARMLALQGCGYAIPTPPRRNCSAILPTCCLERNWLPAPTGHGQRRYPMLPEPIAVTLQVLDALEQVGAAAAGIGRDRAR